MVKTDQIHYTVDPYRVVLVLSAASTILEESCLSWVQPAQFWRKRGKDDI